MLEYILEKQELLCPLCPWRRSSGSCAGGTAEQLSLRRQREPERGGRRVFQPGWLRHLGNLTWKQKYCYFLLVSFTRVLVKTTRSELLFDISPGRCFMQKRVCQGCLAESLEKCLQRSVPPLHLAIWFSLDVSLTSIKSGYPSLVSEH